VHLRLERLMVRSQVRTRKVLSSEHHLPDTAQPTEVVVYKELMHNKQHLVVQVSCQERDST
jgi:hypothetical protein